MIETKDVMGMFVGFEKTEIHKTTSVLRLHPGEWPKQAMKTFKTLPDFQEILLSLWISLPRLPHGSLHKLKAVSYFRP